MARPSLYEFAGRDPAFLALAAAHHARCLADPVLEHPFSHGGHPEHVERLGAYWAEVMGGPPRFSDRCGGQPAMLRLHAGTGADDDLPVRFLSCFVAAMDDVGLPADAEFREAMRAYMTWAVADVHRLAPEGSVVDDASSVPRWGWDGLELGRAGPSGVGS